MRRLRNRLAGIALAGALLGAPASGWSQAADGLVPEIAFRLYQTAFNSEAVIAAEKKELGDEVSDIQVRFADDGIHVGGKFHGSFSFKLPLFNTRVHIPTGTETFEFIIGISWTAPNEFTVTVPRMRVDRVPVPSALAGPLLKMLEGRLNKALPNVLDVKYLGKTDEDMRSLQVSLKIKSTLPPAYSDLELSGIETHEGVLILKAGKAAAQ